MTDDWFYVLFICISIISELWETDDEKTVCNGT